LAVVEPGVAAFRRCGRERGVEQTSDDRTPRADMDTATAPETDVGSSALLERLKSRREVL
jgi:hypothetical protein